MGFATRLSASQHRPVFPSRSSSRSNSLTNIKTLVKRSSGYTILAHAAVFDEVQHRTLIMIPIRDPIIRRTVFLVRNPSKPFTQAAREIERVIVEIIAELVRKKLWLGELAESP